MSARQSEESLAVRRRWFDAHAEELQAAAPRDLRKRFATCPCCGYPTLGGRGGYEICQLCWWEDDGQDEANANEVLGGPNGEYSLAMARINFQRFLVMYPPDKDPRVGGPDSQRALDAKRLVIAAFEAMRESNADLTRLWKQVARGSLELERDLKLSLGESAG